MPRKWLIMSCFTCRPGTLLSKVVLLKVRKDNQPKWRAPPENFYKLNCDGAFFSDPNRGGWVFVIRDSDGQVMAAGADLEEHLINAQHSEIVACLKGIEYAA